MTGPAWLAGALAAVMFFTSGYCLVRLGISVRRQRQTDRSVDAVHVLMGLVMAGVLVPGLRIFRTGGWEIVFGLALAWFAWRWLRSSRAASDRWHYLQHVLGCGAILYMLAAAAPAARTTAGAAPGGMAGAGAIPLLAFALAFALLGFVIWTVDRISALPAVAALATVPQATGPQAGPRRSTGALAWPSLRNSRHPSPAGTHPSPAGSHPSGETARPPVRCAPPLSLRLAASCDIVMGLTMGCMLILMH